MRAVGYFRETGGESLAKQSETFIKFCRENGFEAAATFLEGKCEDDLIGFRQMLEFIRQQKGQGFLVAVVPGLQTLSDGLTEAARRYFQLCSLGLPIVSMETGEEICSDLLQSWARERAGGGLGERVKAAMRKKAVKGEVLGRPPYGYKVGPRRRLVVVPEEGSVVRYIFRLYLKDGLGIRRIARRLNEESLRTRRGGLWSMVTVRDILRNRAYVGTYSRFGVRVPASHAPLISQEDFQRVQERLDQRRPATGTRQVAPFLLSGLLYCGYCGNKMIGVTRKQKWQRRSDGAMRVGQYRYYQCESRTNRSLCDYHTRRANELEAEVDEWLSSGKLLASAAHSGNGSSAGKDAELLLGRLRSKARRLDRRLQQYLDMAVAGSMNQEKLRNAGLAVAVEQLELEEKLLESQRLAERQATESERERQREEIVVRLSSDAGLLSLTTRRELLRQLLERIIVRDDGLEFVVKA